VLSEDELHFAIEHVRKSCSSGITSGGHELLVRGKESCTKGGRETFVLIAEKGELKAKRRSVAVVSPKESKGNLRKNRKLERNSFYFSIVERR